MRMDRELPLTADEIVNYYNEKDLANHLPTWRRTFVAQIARAIVRPGRSTAPDWHRS